MIKEEGIELNGFETVYSISEVEKPAVTVIFIHGFPFNKETWNKQLSDLPNQVQGIAYDIRAQGKSGSGHGFLSIDLFAADLLQLIDQLKIESKIVLCGLSMGGYIALRAMELSNKIDGLILCDTNSEADSNEGKLNRFKSIEKLQNGGKLAFAEEFLKKVLSEITLSDKPELASSVLNMILANSENAISATQLALASRTETSSALKNIEVPGLIIRGNEDKLMTEKQANFLVTEIPDAELVQIPDSGHLPNLENPAEFNQHLHYFLTKHFLS